MTSTIRAQDTTSTIANAAPTAGTIASAITGKTGEQPCATSAAFERTGTDGSAATKGAATAWSAARKPAVITVGLSVRQSVAGKHVRNAGPRPVAKSAATIAGRSVRRNGAGKTVTRHGRIRVVKRGANSVMIDAPNGVATGKAKDAREVVATAIERRL